MTHCSTCFSFTGISKFHSNDSCPIRKSLFCRRCHCKGHTVSECEEPFANLVRPSTLEELIPGTLKQQWGLTSQTRLFFPADLQDAEYHYEYSVPLDKKGQKEFMAQHKINPGKKEDRLKTIREWATQRGYRIRV
jgi:hypothetical protein